MSKLKAFFLAIAFFTCFLSGAKAQMKFNQHNPYVSNSEIFKLKQLGIDLSQQPMLDQSFQNNIQTLLQTRKAYNKEKSKFAALTAGASLGIVSGVAGILLDEYVEPAVIQDDSGMSVPNPNFGRTSIKSQYVLLGMAGIITGAFALKIKIDSKKERNEYEQQMQITKNQYNTLRLK